MSPQETRPRFRQGEEDSMTGESSQVEKARCDVGGCSFESPTPAGIGSHKWMVHGVKGRRQRKGGGETSSKPASQTREEAPVVVSSFGDIGRELEVLLALAELSPTGRSHVLELARARWGL